jgi:hydrogenase maturation factor HypF (carbamoyltransferase family)
MENSSLTLWTNHAVPPNDGGISLGQAALAAFSRFSGEQPDEGTVQKLYA